MVYSIKYRVHKCLKAKAVSKAVFFLSLPRTCLCCLCLQPGRSPGSLLQWPTFRHTEKRNKLYISAASKNRGFCFIYAIYMFSNKCNSSSSMYYILAVLASMQQCTDVTWDRVPWYLGCILTMFTQRHICGGEVWWVDLLPAFALLFYWTTILLKYVIYGRSAVEIFHS